MAPLENKSSTDLFWNNRAIREHDPAKVNIIDTVQRDHELQFVLPFVGPSIRMVEIGCGNGYVTQLLRSRVAHIDGFDYAENMVERARQLYGETNNRFIHDSVLDPKVIGGDYDLGLCVRVLINLRNLAEQKRAIYNIARMLRYGGRLILIEGFRDGFDAINRARQTLGLAPAVPAAINFYSYVSELMPTILEYFKIDRTWHSGMFDFLTRIVYPQLVGAEAATEPGDFHLKIEPIVRANTLPDLGLYARVRGFALIRTGPNREPDS